MEEGGTTIVHSIASQATESNLEQRRFLSSSFRECPSIIEEKDTTMFEKKTLPVQPATVKVKDLMAFIYYVKVDEVRQNGDTLVVTDIDHKNTKMEIKGTEIISSALSADQFYETQKCNMTQAADILIHSGRLPFTVCFDKKDGEERTLRGRFLSQDPHMGRSNVEDLDIASGHRIRQVDHRTIHWIVFEGVKYEVK